MTKRPYTDVERHGFDGFTVIVYDARDTNEASDLAAQVVDEMNEELAHFIATHDENPHAIEFIYTY